MRPALLQKRLMVGSAVLAFAGALACSGSSSPETETNAVTTCRSAQALSVGSFTGASLGSKQLALTFDDGPGSKTLELSGYLKAQGIRAAFFVNGHCFTSGNPCGNPGIAAATILTQVIADGHIVANHTQDHHDLTSNGYFPPGAAGDAALVKELADTDAILAPYVPANRFLFRPPYGAWSARDYATLHASTMDKYYGPVRWDVGGSMVGNDTTGYAADWDCWQNLDGFGVKTTKQCATRYLNEITAVGRGIVLMHDADYGNVANHDINVGKGNSLDVVKYVVPLLKAQGYTFVRLDEVPAIASVLPPLPPPPDAGTSPEGGSDAGSDATADAGTTRTSSPPSAPPPGAGPAPDPSMTKDPCASAPADVVELPYNLHAH